MKKPAPPSRGAWLGDIMFDVEAAISKNPKLKLAVLRLREEGKSQDYIKSYVIGWLKGPSELEQAKKKNRRR